MADLRGKPQPLAYAVTDAPEACGISKSLLEQIIARDELHVRWVNSKRVILASELQAWLENLPYDRDLPERDEVAS